MGIIVIDIETVRDESIWMPPDPPVASEMREYAPRSSPSWQPGNLGTLQGWIVPPPVDHFAPPHGWKVICIGFVLLEWKGNAMNVAKLGAVEEPAPATDEQREVAILRRFSAAQSSGKHTVVTWNGRRFDMPVLMLRSMRYGVSCGWYYNSRDNRYRFSEDGHCDLADAMSDYGASAHLNLDGMAKLIGLPGKFGDIDGKGVGAAYAAGRLAAITDYCIADAVMTAFLWMRWQLHKGAWAHDEYQAAAGELLARCEADERLSEFRARVDRKVLLLEAAA